MDIIDETGPDVVSRLNQDFVFRMQASPGAGNVKSLERLWSSQSNEVRATNHRPLFFMSHIHFSQHY
jgi:hypothetical protein